MTFHSRALAMGLAAGTLLASACGGETSGTSGVGGTGGAAACTGALLSCDGVCVDTLVDAKHCGACGVECPAACVAGACEIPPPQWKLKGTKSAEVITGSCSDTETKVVPCIAATLGVEGRVVDAIGIELKAPLVEPLIGALLGRTGTVSEDGTQLTLTGRTGCGQDKISTMTVTYYVCE